ADRQARARAHHPRGAGYRSRAHGAADDARSVGPVLGGAPAHTAAPALAGWPHRDSGRHVAAAGPGYGRRDLAADPPSDAPAQRRPLERFRPGVPARAPRYLGAGGAPDPG